MARLGRGTLIEPIEAAVLLAAAIALATLANAVDAFERLSDFLAKHETWQLDELAFVLLFSGAGALALLARRGAELIRAIAQREAAEARALTLARHDPLTGLTNRRVLHEELPTLIEKAVAAGKQCTVFVIDLDHFKPINDAFGHETGDAALLQVAARLQRICGSEGIISRIGGDEFVLAMPQEEGADAPARTAGEIIRTLSIPYAVKGRRVEMGATVGIARYPLDAADAAELLRIADVAMYDGKRAGRGRYSLFHARMDERLRARMALEAELRGALDRDEITPYFQPVISLAENRIIGFEALARWDHPTRGTIMPDAFISIAEDMGLISALTNQVLRAGCIASRDWHAETTLSINISPLQLKDSWLAAGLLAILAETGFPAHRLIVEVTENAIIEDVEQAAMVFASLQNVGIRIALDDFGRGYSSLSHLRQLKFNHLKIDSSFVQSMDSEESRQIVSAVAGLGKALGMPVTAEGVESVEVAAALQALGCEQAQGYLFGRPGSATQAAYMLREDDARNTGPQVACA